MKIMGLDIGDVRIGIAQCDEMEIIASGVESYTRTGDLTKDCLYLANKAKELGAKAIVLGLPINMNGTHGPRAEHAVAFAEILLTVVLEQAFGPFQLAGLGEHVKICLVAFYFDLCRSRNDLAFLNVILAGRCLFPSI